MLVQDIEEAVCEAPHEEEDGDEGYLMMSENTTPSQEIDLQE